MAEQRSTLIIEISSEQAARNARALDRELQSIERTGNYATTSMNSMSVAARQLAGYLAGVVTVGTAISKMDTYTGLQNRLKLVTNDQKALNQAMQDTFGIAQKTAASWDSTAMVYQRFADNAQRLGIAMKTTAELTETVSKAISISGGSAASAEAALMQFGQALASGVLRGEEFNSIAEQAPGLLKAIAQGMGVNIGQLRSMAGEGKITGDALVSALTNAKTSVDELFGKTDFTIAQSFTQLSNAVTKFVGEAGKGSGAASAISSSLSSLANNLDTVTNIAMIGGAYWLGTYIPALYKSVAAQQTRITTLVSEVRAEQLANEITAQRTARIAHLSTIELANAEAQLARMTGMARIAYLEKTVLPLRQANTAALQADTIAQNANNASKSLATRAGTSLIGVLGGPVGLGLTVAAVGASMLLMGDNTESATNSLENQKKTVSELTAEYGKLSTAKLVSEMDEIDKRVSAAESKISKSKNGLLGMVAGNSDSISNEEIKRQNLILDQLKKIEKEGLSTASALQAIDASKLFTDGEIKQAQKFFAKMEEGNNELVRGVAERQLADSALKKSSGIYENLAKESSNLTLEHERLTSSLESAKSSFSFVSNSLLQSAANAGVSSQGIENLRNSINAYSRGTLSATALLKEFQKHIPIKDSDIKSYLQVANNVEAQQKALTLNEIQLKKNKSTQDGLNKSLSDSNVTGTNFNKVLEDGTKKAVATSESVKGLSAEIQKFINQSLSDISTNSEILALRAKGISKEVAENYVKLKEAQGLLGKNQPIDTGAFSLMMADLALKKQIQDLDDKQTESEKKRTEELRKQQRIQEQTIKSKTIDSVIARGEGNYNSFNKGKAGDSVGSKLNLVDMTVGQIRSLQKNGSIFAAGKYQTIPSTLQGAIDAGIVSVAEKFNASVQERIVQQYLLTAKKDRGNIEDYIKGKNDNLTAANIDLSKEFASVANPLTGKSYYDGKAGNKASISVKDAQNALKASRELYAQAIASGKSAQDAWKSAFNSSISFIDGSKTQKDIDKYTKEQMDEAEQIQKSFRTKSLQEEQEYKEQLKKIRENSTLSGDEKKTYEAQLTTRFDAQKKLNDLQQDYELNGYKYTEDQKLIYQRDSAKEQLDAEGKYSDEVKALHKKSIDDLYNYEVVKSKLAKDQRLLQATEFYMSELQIAQAKYDIERRLLAESNVDPKEKAFKSQMLELQNQVDMNRRLKDASIGWDSVQSQMNGSTGRFQVSQDRFSRMGVSQNLFDTQIADVERQEQEPGADLQKLAEVREQIWTAHNKRMIDIENQYQADSLNLQLTQAQQLTGSFANMFKGILGESSGAYKTMFAMQQGFALTQAGMNLWSSVSDAYAKEPGTVWQKVTAGAKAALDQGTFLAMIQAITPQGFATGGHITGKGTGTSDDIPIMASNGEFMMKASAVSKLGLSALNYMNQTGEIPFQREYLAMKSQYLGSTQPDLNVQKFKDGGLVGVSRLNNADTERSQFNSVQQTNIGLSQPKVTIINQTSQPVEATTQWDGSELQVVLKEMQKQNEAQTKSLISQSWRDAERQGGALDRIKKGR
jgi:tape measure domain-containing protein